MKNSNYPDIRDLSHDELINSAGGSFAYDVGRVLRFVALDYYYGHCNAVGTNVAMMDFVINMQENAAA
jgi:hypothetical protein